MKNTIRLNENQLASLVNQILSEQVKAPTLNAGHFKYSKPNFYKDYIEHMSDGVYTDFDSAYDYRLYGGVWSAKRKNGTKWFDLTDYPKAITILTQKLEQHFKQPDPKPKPEDETILTPQQKLMKAKSCGFNSWIDYKSSGFKCGKQPDPKPKPEDETILTPQQKLIKAKDCGFNSWIDYKSSGFKCGKKPTPKPVDKSDTIISRTTSPIFLPKVKKNQNLINPSKSNPIFPAGQTECAQFVHEYDENMPKNVGNAWVAHDNSSLGSLIFSSFHNLTPNNIKTAINFWLGLNKRGGGVENGEDNDDISKFVNTLVPSKPSVSLKLGDVVGLYYPGSHHFEEAFYGGGKIFFTKNSQGKPIPGNTIKSGKGWGMNTHLGIVGAIKDGQPIIFHNVMGQVWADPINQIHGNCRIAWVRRHGAEPIALNNLKTQMPMSEQITNFTVKKKSIYEQKPDNLMPFQPDNPGSKESLKRLTSYQSSFNKYKCVPEDFRIAISELINAGYNKRLLKASLGIIGRESSYASGNRYNWYYAFKLLGSVFNTSLGPAQMKPTTAAELGMLTKITDNILTFKGSLIAVYRYLSRSYKRAKEVGYLNTPSSNFTKGTGDAALDISIASYNIGYGRIVKYCKTDDPKIKRPCSMSGKIVEQSGIGAPNYGITKTNSPNVKINKTMYKVSNQLVNNYLPNIHDGDLTTHGYIEEVSKRMKGFNCF